jgi:hypothetical protein
MSRDAEVLDGSPAKPRTFSELKRLSETAKACQRCGQPATHSLAITAAKLGSAKAIEAMIRKVPVCEACGVDLVVVFKRALKV